MVYDCLYPCTVGGAERWYRNLAERLAAGRARGHLPDPAPVGPGRRRRLRRRPRDRGRPADGALHGPGRRRILPPLVFGAGVLGTCAPRPPLRRRPHGLVPVLLAARRGAGPAAGAATELVVDWHEVWSARLLARVPRPGGRRGRLRRPAALRAAAPARLLLLARCTRDRLRAEGLRGEVDGARGRVRRAADAAPSRTRRRRSSSSRGGTSPRSACRRVVGAVARAREPARAARGDLRRRTRARRGAGGDPRRGLEGVVEAPGFVDAAVIDDALRGALCMVLPSSREGYGLVVVEAAARGTPSVVVAGPTTPRSSSSTRA